MAGSKLPDSITGRVSAAIVGLIEVNRKKIKSSDRLKEISSFIRILPIERISLEDQFLKREKLIAHLFHEQLKIKSLGGKGNYIIPAGVIQDMCHLNWL